MTKTCISINNEFSNIGPTRRTWLWRLKVKKKEEWVQLACIMTPLGASHSQQAFEHSNTCDPRCISVVCVPVRAF